MPTLRFDMRNPQREGFTRQMINGLDIWAYTLPLAQGASQYSPPMTRRVDNSYVNATRLLQLTALNPNQKTKELMVQPTIVMRGGLNNIQGTWVPLERARAIAKKYDIEQDIAPILFDPSQPPKSFVDERCKPMHSSVKRRKTSTGVAASPKASAGSSRAGSGSGTSDWRSGATSGRHSEPIARARGNIAGALSAMSAGSSARKQSASGSSSDRQTDSRLGKRKAGAADSAGPSSSTSKDGRPQQVEIASWTARSQGGDSNSQTGWYAGPVNKAGASSSSDLGASSSASGSGAASATTNGTTNENKQGVDATERLRPRPPTLSELRNMLQTNKRRDSSPGMRSTASSSLPRSSLRSTADTAGSSRDHNMSTAGPSSNGQTSSSWSTADAGTYPSFNRAEPSVLNGGPSRAGLNGGPSRAGLNGGPSRTGLSSSSPSLTVHDPTTWDSKYVAAFGRSRGWDEQRVLSKLREGDIDGTLLLSLDFNDQSVFVLNQCGIKVPGDQIRIIQAAEFLREYYPTGPDHRLFGQASHP
ncbi:hypothetical protein CF327_g6327 [Tilletia walkeri]|uniref:HTH APSES-type domain-containing protein n=1 Tax=Tilletia walkeri TaxID=117179 RepID=A0A8X7N6I4_9BASI|nr:hypothetical protein CF327_g6327 [Tilletia walkeri]KAE8267302.1 hypothetical protein A4X09_0g5044 [Tilletia walkeri]